MNILEQEIKESLEEVNIFVEFALKAVDLNDFEENKNYALSSIRELEELLKKLE